MQGDVTHIVDASGVVKAEYIYDAWGKCTILTDTDGIGSLNPIRYRGYYYDTETKLYYLQSRYYDPEIGRFINMDDISYLEPQMLNGLNIYAYCNNNPVMYIDPNGNFPILIALILGGLAIAGAAIGGKIAHDNAVAKGYEGWDLFWATAKGIVLGGAAGFAAGGAIIMGIGIGFGIFGAAGVATSVLGVTALQAFAIGILAFNTTAWLIMPLFGYKMEGIDFQTPNSPDTPPQPNIPVQVCSMQLLSARWKSVLRKPNDYLRS